MTLRKDLMIMKKSMKCLLKLAAVGAAIGGAFAYLKNKGYISVTTGHEDEDLDDFSSPDSAGTERTYINVDTYAMKAKAKEMAQDVKTKASEWAGKAQEMASEWTEKAQDKAEDIAEDIMDKAEDAYDEAKKAAGNVAANVANAVEKAWYETEEKVEDTVEKVEEFFNDED